MSDLEDPQDLQSKLINQFIDLPKEKKEITRIKYCQIFVVKILSMSHGNKHQYTEYLSF